MERKIEWDEGEREWKGGGGEGEGDKHKMEGGERGKKKESHRDKYKHYS